MRALLFEFIAGESGQDLVEYALLASLISLTAMAGVLAFGGGVGGLSDGVFGRAVVALATGR